MKMIKTLVASALLATAFSAQAAVVTLADVSDVAVKKGAFAHNYYFSLAGNANANLDSWNNVSINKRTKVTITDIQDGFVSVFSQTAPTVELHKFNLDTLGNSFSLLKGDYFFTVSGNAFGSNGGNYDFLATANVAPVPEPETYALMGMGLVGLLAARRRKAKKA